MVSFSSFNPACYMPTGVNNYLPSAVACAPPPSYFSSAYNIVTSPFSSTYGAVRAMFEALVGLPFLSILLIPTTGSWSTTINFFFFYLTWSTLILSHPPLRIELIGSLAIRVIFYILPSLAFLGFDVLLPSAAEGLKAYGNKGLPFVNASRNEALRQLRPLGWALLNILISALLQTTIELLLTKVFLFHSALRVTTSLPSPITILKNLAQGYMLREVLTYTIHRYVLHESDNIAAKYHQNWYHDIEAPYPLSGSYDHPLPYLLHKFLPAYLPAFLLRFHLLTYLIYLSIISLEETFTYSGYSTVPTNFILGGIARRTDTHIIEEGEGNYGCIGLVDWIMGTSIGGNLGDDLRDEADKHDVQGRTKMKGSKMFEAGKAKANGQFAKRRGRKNAE